MQIVVVKEFSEARFRLNRDGRKVQGQKVNAALVDAQMDGEIKLPRTKHGESRADVEKYDLGDGYRLVVFQTGEHCIFVYVGKHDDVDRWLDNHRDYRWVFRASDRTLSFIPVTVRTEEIPHVPSTVALSSDVVERSLFSCLTEEQWAVLRVSDATRAAALAITNVHFECGQADDLLLALEDIQADAHDCLIDLCSMSYNQQFSSIGARVELLSGRARIVEAEALGQAVRDVVSTEELISFDDPQDLSDYLTRERWDDWQLYLHPAQRALVTREFQGPARLRGISGSGKTSILVHRARYLARRYCQPVLAITLTGSMSRLLRQLKDSLCGEDEWTSRRIRTSTLIHTVLKVLEEFDGQWLTEMKSGAPTLTMDSTATLNILTLCVLRSGVIDLLHKEPSVVGSGLLGEELLQFVRDEVQHVRSSFSLDARCDYLDSKRTGRGLALGRESREAVARLTESYEQTLASRGMVDPDGLILRGLQTLRERIDWDALVAIGDYPYPLSRCVLVDEAQDMSENALRLISMLSPRRENSLFVVGDGAQKVFNHGFAFSRAGIDVTGRSVIFRKNYRNTRQILQAAFPLVQTHVNLRSEENTLYLEGKPEFSSREGLQPEIRSFDTEEHEYQWIAERIAALIGGGIRQGKEILVISASPRVRDLVGAAIKERGVATISIKSAGASVEEDGLVRISTIESAKGLEFPIVFIAGLNEGTLPTYGAVARDELWLEASRLYVAMTRARDELCLSYSLRSEGQKRLPSQLLELFKGQCTCAHVQANR